MAQAAGSKSVLVPIANGSEEIEAVTIIDTLRRHAFHAQLINVPLPAAHSYGVYAYSQMIQSFYSSL